MSEAFKVVIPARYASTRFPGKALAELDGRPMLWHVIARARESSAAEIIVATDDTRIERAARSCNADVIITRTDHESGTDRVAEVALARAWADDNIVVNVQGDAPLMPGTSIDQVAALLSAHPSANIATLATQITDRRELLDPNTVKVILDAEGRALYFSRAPIPAASHATGPSAEPLGWRHIGLYAYRVAGLRQMTAAPSCWLENAEGLEQLRALWLGMEIRVGEAKETHGPDVDTPENLVAAEQFLRRQ